MGLVFMYMYCTVVKFKNWFNLLNVCSVELSMTY